MATNTTLPSQFEGIPDGEVQQWLNHPCTKAVKAAVQQDIETATGFLIAEAQRAKLSEANIRALGAQYQARRELMDIMFGGAQ